MKILVLTNGEYGDYSFCKSLEGYDYVICADNGMKHARYLGVTPDYILGDFDSSSREDLKYFQEQQIEIYKVPTIKDETDTELAIDYAAQLGAKRIDVFGGLGSRIDHSLGNIHLLYKGLKQGIEVHLINPNNDVTLIDKEIELVGEEGQLISLLPLTEKVMGVTTWGLAYALEKGVFELGKPYGVSNYMIDRKAGVRIDSGALLVIKSQD
ncbi:MAG: thiamine diphosphokinase [Cellulosilyticaceae bacterium]